MAVVAATPAPPTFADITFRMLYIYLLLNNKYIYYIYLLAMSLLYNGHIIYLFIYLFSLWDVHIIDKVISDLI